MELRNNETLHEVNEHIRLIQRTDGLTFGTDAYLLSAYVRPQPNAIAVDLGSGTGIIPLLCLARNKASHFTAVEIQPAFGELIHRNAALNGFADRITPPWGARWIWSPPILPTWRPEAARGMSPMKSTWPATRSVAP